MNIGSDSPVHPEYRIGEPVRRTEDPTLLRGEGRYTDDLNEPGQAYAHMVRSPHAHGLLKGISLEKAKAMSGVLAIYTAADLAAYGPHKCMLDFKQRDGSPMKRPVRKSLAADKVRFVGDPVACVVAESAVQAKDAAEAVELDIEPLPAVALASEAAKPGAPQLYDDVPGNVALDFLFGEPEKVAGAFAQAAHVTRLALRIVRRVNCADARLVYMRGGRARSREIERVVGVPRHTGSIERLVRKPRGRRDGGAIPELVSRGRALPG